MTALKIRIAPMHQVRTEMVAVASGELKIDPDQAKISFPSLPALMNVLSEENLAILRNIRTQSPPSVGFLAKYLGKEIPELKKQLGVLSNFGIIRLEPIADSNELRPVLVSNEFQINMSI